MMSVIERAFEARAIPPGHSCLYVRTEELPTGGYKEYSYVGPQVEVDELGRRCLGVDMEAVDELLRKGYSFEDALKELGIP